MAKSNRRSFLTKAPAVAVAAAAASPAQAEDKAAGTPVKKVHWTEGKRPEKPPLLQRKVRLRDPRAEDESSPTRDRRPNPTALPIDQAPPRPEPPPNRGDLLHAAVALPAIQISIGRIEVEAMLPPSPAAAPAVRRAAVPRLSLDEYLARRNGSGT